MRDILINLNDIDSTLYDTAIIRQGEHNASQLIITLDSETSGYSNNIIFRLNQNEPQVASDVQNINNVITYPIPNTTTYEAGILKIEIQCYDDSDFLIKSITIPLKVSKAIDGLPIEIPPNLWDDFPEGLMSKSIYDPNSISKDAFDMNNMIETATSKIFTNTERTKLTGINGDVEATPNTYIIRDSEGDSKVNAVEYDLNPIGIHEEGKTKWNDTRHTLDIGLTGTTDIALQVGQDVTVWVYNDSGHELEVGTVVSISGVTNGITSVIMADANASPQEKNAIGVVCAYTIPIAGHGYVLLNGLISNITTSDFEEGDLLYLSDEAGRIINHVPDLPAVPVQIGWCIEKAGNGLGRIYVKVDRFQIAEEIPIIDSGGIFDSDNVEDVLIEIANNTKSAYAEIYVYNANTPQTIPFGTTYTKLTPFMATGESKNCTANAENQRIIIGTNGKYQVSSTFSSHLDSNGNILETAFFKNGIEVQKAHIIRKIAVSGEPSTGSATCILNLEIGDILDVRVRHDRGSDVDITTRYGNFNVIRLCD